MNEDRTPIDTPMPFGHCHTVYFFVKPTFHLQCEIRLGLVSLEMSDIASELRSLSTYSFSIQNCFVLKGEN